MTCFAPALTANLRGMLQSRSTLHQGVDVHKHAENSCAASHVQDDFVFEEVFVLIDGVLI